MAVKVRLQLKLANTRSPFHFVVLLLLHGFFIVTLSVILAGYSWRIC